MGDQKYLYTSSEWIINHLFPSSSGWLKLSSDLKIALCATKLDHLGRAVRLGGKQRVMILQRLVSGMTVLDIEVNVMNFVAPQEREE